MGLTAKIVGVARAVFGLTPGSPPPSAANPTLTGTAVVRQTGGVAGTDEVQISHTGSTGIVESKDGGLRVVTPAGTFLDLEAGGTGVVRIQSGVNLQVQGTLVMLFTKQVAWNSDSGVGWAAAGVLKVTNGSTGGGQLEFPQVADVGTPNTDSARIGAENVGGTAELVGSDEAGNETQLTPHAADAPASLYDHDGAEEVHRTINTFLDRVEYLNLTRLARLVERIAAGDLAGVQALPADRRQCLHVETLAECNARTGRAKRRRTWAEGQREAQAAYDEGRRREAAALAAWEADPRGEEEKGDRPAVRPARNVRKPKPKWLAARGA